MGKRTIFSLLALLVLASCNRQGGVADRLDDIKTVGDSNPELALQMLDSLALDVRRESRHTQSTFDLLHIRLSDKADIAATSDIAIRELLPYFERMGSNTEQQEVYYYAGSVYRDLQDAPRALEYFLKSAETAKSGAIDSVLLRNTYSQLSSLYFNVQDYENALKMALCQKEVAEQLDMVDVTTLSQIACSKLRVTGYKEAKAAFDTTLDYILKHKTAAYDSDVLSDLLYSYSIGKDTLNARRCHDILASLERNGKYSMLYDSWAPYYILTENIDSAIWCYQHVLEMGNLENQYDASRHLHEIYQAKGDKEMSLKYARMYMEISNELDLGKRQELAATVNNMYTYHRDMQETRSLQDRAINSQRMTWATAFLSILTILVVGLYMLIRKNRFLKQLVSAECKLKDAQKETERVNEELQQEQVIVEKLNSGIAQSREQLSTLQSQMQDMKSQLKIQQEKFVKKEKELHELNQKIAILDDENKNNAKLLTEKMEQNKVLFRLLHQSELQENSDDVILAIKEASKGKRALSAQEWSQFLCAMDNIYPRFHEMLVQRLGKISETQIRVCYLMKAGIVNSQIQNLINDVSRATVWRWAKKFGEELGDAIYAK